MEELFYNILWIDDEHETLSGTKGRAKRNGINLMPFKSLNSGMNELERNYPLYDGVLLDAKFFENEDDVKGSEDTYNVHRAKERLLQLKKKFEVFVLTGQAEAYEDKTFNKAFAKVYKKGSDEEIDRLFSDIKVAASNQEDTQIRHNYKCVFDVCTEKYIGELAGQDILNLLKVNDETNIDNHFNSIRKVVEDLFIAFNKYNLLPIEFVTPSVALNESSKFLAGKGSDGSLFSEKGYQHLEETHLPKLIAFYLRGILSVTQAGSHRSDIDLYVKTIKTPFLLKSVFFQLLDVLAWFKMYVDGNPKAGNWVKVVETSTQVTKPKAELIHGKVININTQKGYAFFKPDGIGENVFIPPHLVTNHSLEKDMSVKVEIEKYTDNRAEEIKYRVKRVELE
ncbi:hypothetical protein G5B00_10645 [Parapedobacter sp. SGR-10]|uniref:hypothetical protein n=1 Tax=Parapedobacter sp. SGR-10 TaxID=2710879 RepID=UPI0013D19E4F|nr:hypothetical protein [Parapedobacter sp. SGR-10]NGF56973.1 hypothetical protein [Parapedobacter sp. SGR-10]